MTVRRIWPLWPEGRNAMVGMRTSLETECASTAQEKGRIRHRSGPNGRRSLLGEFSKRHGYNIPLRQKIPEKTFRKMLNQHLGRSLPVMKLSDVVLILDEQRFSDADKQIATTGGKLKAKRSEVKSNFALSGPPFSTSLLTRWLPYAAVYLKTLMYGYVVCPLKDNPENPRFTLN